MPDYAIMISAALGIVSAIGLVSIFLFRLKAPSAASFEEHMMGGSDQAIGDLDRRPIGSLWRKSDRVSAAASAPSNTTPGETIRIWVTLSNPREIEKLSLRRATQLGVTATPPTTLNEKMKRGSVLDVVLTSVAIPESNVVRLRWSGKSLEASFLVTVPADFEASRVEFDVSVFTDQLCVGVIPLSIAVSKKAEVERPSRFKLAAPKRIFVSYSSLDRNIAITVARAYKRIGIETFMDRLSLEGGELWEERIAAELDRCDAVYLIWSPASAQSKYVLWEVRRALERRLNDQYRRPLIITHVVGTPPPASPPEGLEALQFNDPVFALWEQSIRDARG